MNQQTLPRNKGTWTPEEDQILRNVLNDWPGTVDDKIQQIWDTGRLNRTKSALKARATHIRKIDREVPKIMCNWSSEEDAYILQALSQPYITRHKMSRLLHAGPLKHRTVDAVSMRISWLFRTQKTLVINRQN